MTLQWGAVVPLALVAREWAGRVADAILDQVQSPPGYGSPDDTDWRPDSEHERQRRQIDEEVARFLGECD